MTFNCPVCKTEGELLAQPKNSLIIKGPFTARWLVDYLRPSGGGHKLTQVLCCETCGIVFLPRQKAAIQPQSQPQPQNKS